jgi:hypothetical protein
MVSRNASHPDRVTVEIAGRLNAPLGEQAWPHKVQGVWGKLVAREGHATTLIKIHKASEFNDLIATGERI